MISYFFNIPFDEVENLYVTDYALLLEQAQNIANLLRGSEFKLVDSQTEHEEFLATIKMFEEQGRL